MIVKINNSELKETIEKNKKCVVVFITDGCPLCVDMEKKLQKYNSYIWYVCNVKDSNDFETKKYTYNSFPTTILFQDKEVKIRYTGLLYETQTKDLLSQL